MKILFDFKIGHEGNDCWIDDYICLIQLDTSLFIVTFTETVNGSWTGRRTNTECAHYTNYDEAFKEFTILVERVKR